MPKIQYIAKRFNSNSQVLIVQAIEIIENFIASGYSLTLRQLYYQLVAGAVIENTVRSYDRLGSLINDARLAGLIDWDTIVDRTRNLAERSHWEMPDEIVKSAADDYGIDLWQDQTHRPEVWIEKDALVGVIEATCTELDVPFFSCRGYTSQSEMWRAGRRMLYHIAKSGQKPVVIHLGDHDPSGIDMTRDIEDRLRMFVGEPVKVVRAALNMDQIEQYEPPPNPAKTTDSRYQTYMNEYGTDSWELDALTPQVINALVREHVNAHMIKARWKRRKKLQETRRATLTNISDNYDQVIEYLEGSE